MYLRRWMTNEQEMMRPQEVSLHLGPECAEMTDPDGNARAMDGRILQVSREDIADILQVANGPDNLFSQQRGTPDVIQTDPNNHVGVTTT
ncbi:hypothetical protein F2Q68_00032575 [Brassica cretica]|uniref:Uncharacterized protein n=1 Tax=Brassica cretica TaxID=69181 RepID=A0A8S9G3U7_BRACR|nr:hypothetical protein F2Q68_00032575 [Brassica cretica]